MIVLTVVSFNGAAVDGPQARFDELGGSIGRADGNQLVLPDPERSISRQHARVVFRSGQYAVVDNGSNAISVNGQQVPAGREHTLHSGDQLQIGGYLLQVSQASAATGPAHAFADLFGDGAHGLAAPLTSAKPAWSPAPQAAPVAAPAPTGQIPDDWDFLAPAAAPFAASFAAPTAAPLLSASGMDSIDDLFGLAPGGVSGDPLGAAQAQALLLQPNMAGHADPLRALAGSGAVVPASSLSDHVSELNTPMPLPQRAPGALFATAATPPAATHATTQLAPLSAPPGAVFSWHNPPRDGRLVTLPGMPSPNALPAPQPLEEPAVQTTLIRPAPPPSPPLQPPPTLAPAPPPLAPAAGPVDAPAGAQLLAALLQGLDTPGLRIDQLSPDLMRLLGQLLRESTRGAVELLAARAALKREMRATMTMIQGRENNPLKFSPTADAALLHLMGPPVAGFMPPALAVRDAFDDLRAHQLGVMAGMKAAVEGVLQRFDPQQLEAKLSTRPGLASLIPATRKARLWELFQQLYGQLSAEAQDDADDLFGKAFLRAYQAQLDRLQADPTSR